MLSKLLKLPCRKFKTLDLVPISSSFVVTRDDLRRFAPFGTFSQFKKHKNTRGGVLLLVLKVTFLHGCFSRFLNCEKVLKRAKHHSSFLR